MKTIQELEKYLEENGYSFQDLTIGKHHAPEGYIIEAEPGTYNFSYSERGNKRLLKSFDKEEDLVKHALSAIDKSEWARAHLLAWVYSESEILEVENILKNRRINFQRNDIPNYKAGECAYRIFVFGNDILKLDDVKRKYFRQ